MIKVFRRKKFFSSAFITPYSKRFVRNVGELKQRGFFTVEVFRHVHCPERCRYLVFYHPIAGKTLRTSLECSAQNIHDINLLARFVARLHQKGVFFRSLHFGNIIVPPGKDQFGLIDVADMRFSSKPLSYRKRVRNYKHMIRYKEDLSAILSFGSGNFLDSYLSACDLSRSQELRFIECLKKEIPVFS